MMDIDDEGMRMPAAPGLRDRIAPSATPAADDHLNSGDAGDLDAVLSREQTFHFNLVGSKSSGDEISILKSGTPGRIRTCDLLLRRQTLYPAELRVHVTRFYRTRRAAH
jgi:hypothetical protein